MQIRDPTTVMRWLLARPDVDREQADESLPAVEAEERDTTTPRPSREEFMAEVDVLLHGAFR